MAEALAGSEGARLPGRRRQEMRARLLRDGIVVDDALAAEIEAIGR
jgi:(2R)-3-sulfolactate dehydrogenase (NADP+)